VEARNLTIVLSPRPRVRQIGCGDGGRAVSTPVSQPSWRRAGPARRAPAKAATTTIPIVFAYGGRSVAEAWSRARPAVRQRHRATFSGARPANRWK